MHRGLGGKGQHPTVRPWSLHCGAVDPGPEQRLWRGRVTTGRTAKASVAQGKPASDAQVSQRTTTKPQTAASPCAMGSMERSRLTQMPHLTARPATQQFQNTPHNHSSNPPVFIFLKKKKEEPTKQKQGSHLAPMGTGHASLWASLSTPARLQFEHITRCGRR